MRLPHCLLLCLLGLGSVGCAADRGMTTVQTRGPASRPADEPALLTLEQVPLDPPAAAATQPAAAAPLDAIELYAHARAAQLAGARAQAVNLLRLAIELDPGSFELQYALGLAYAAGANGNPQATEALERAAQLKPDNHEVRIQLGRQYLTSQSPDYARATVHLRLALASDALREDAHSRALVHLLLGRALHQSGYELAALRQYELLLQRLEVGRSAFRGSPELTHLASRIEVLLAQVGDLHLRVGQRLRARQLQVSEADAQDLGRRSANHLAAAVRAYQAASARLPENLEYSRKLLDAMLDAGLEGGARKTAGELVARHRASRESLELLREVLRRLGRQDELVSELKRMLESRPGNRRLLIAVVDALRGGSNDEEAWRLLAGLPVSALDGAALDRMVQMHRERRQLSEAARLLIEVSAARGELVSEMAAMMDGLCQPGMGQRLTLRTLEELTVDPTAAGARYYWTAHVADRMHRTSLARSLLSKATAQRPVFRPAFRLLLESHLATADLEAAQQDQEVQKLIEAARQGGDEALAAQLRGLAALYRKEMAAATTALLEAREKGDASPEVAMALAAARLQAGQSQAAEQLMWQIISEHPGFEQGYQTLFGHYMAKPSAQLAVKVMHTWLEAQPQSVQARLLQANIYIQVGRLDEAESLVTTLLRQSPQEPAVVAAVMRFYGQASRLKELPGVLEEQRRRLPSNGAIVDALVGLYVSLDRPDDALRVVEAMRSAVGRDGELLYRTAQLYERAGHKAKGEQVLRDVLRLDPMHPGASNDLGYLWAEAGQNLQEAEALVRVALQAEPQSAPFLDSLGWVLYKQRKFEDARRQLERAARGPSPDPVVLDHLGDTLYQLQLLDQASGRWEQAMQGLGNSQELRPDLKKLRSQLQRKLDQHRQGQAVDVAPIPQGSGQAHRNGT